MAKQQLYEQKGSRAQISPSMREYHVPQWQTGNNAGQRLFQTMLEAGMGLNRILAEDHKRTQLAKVDDLDLKFNEEWTRFSADYFQNNQGSMAVNTVKDFEETFSRLSEKYIKESGFSDDEIAKSLLTRKFAARGLSAFKEALTFQESQKSNWFKSQFESQCVDLLNFVNQNPYDADAISYRINDLFNSYDAKNPGLDNRAVKDRILKQVMQQRFDAYISRGDSESAERLLKQWDSMPYGGNVSTSQGNFGGRFNGNITGFQGVNNGALRDLYANGTYRRRGREIPLETGTGQVTLADIEKRPVGDINNIFNNPGNLKTVKGDFKMFATFDDGGRAVGGRVLRYQDAYKCRTLKQFCNKYAPESDGNKGYARGMALYTGKPLDWQYDRNNPDDVATIIQAVIYKEQGYNVPYETCLSWARDVIQNGEPEEIGTIASDRKRRVAQFERGGFNIKLQDRNIPQSANTGQQNAPQNTGQDSENKSQNASQETENPYPDGMLLTESEAPNTDTQGDIRTGIPAQGGNGFSANSQRYEGVNGANWRKLDLLKNQKLASQNAQRLNDFMQELSKIPANERQQKINEFLESTDINLRDDFSRKLSTELDRVNKAEAHNNLNQAIWSLHQALDKAQSDGMSDAAIDSMAWAYIRGLPIEMQKEATTSFENRRKKDNAQRQANIIYAIEQWTGLNGDLSPVDQYEFVERQIRNDPQLRNDPKALEIAQKQILGAASMETPMNSQAFMQGLIKIDHGELWGDVEITNYAVENNLTMEQRSRMLKYKGREESVQVSRVQGLLTRIDKETYSEGIMDNTLYYSILSRLPAGKEQYSDNEILQAIMDTLSTQETGGFLGFGKTVTDFNSYLRTHDGQIGEYKPVVNDRDITQIKPILESIGLPMSDDMIASIKCRILRKNTPGQENGVSRWEQKVWRPVLQAYNQSRIADSKEPIAETEANYALLIEKIMLKMPPNFIRGRYF